MSESPSVRTLPWDWYPGAIPPNVVVDHEAYVETAFSFLLMRSRREHAVVYQRGAATYLGTMFDLGAEAQVVLGEYALVHGSWFICDRRVEIGDYSVISWNTVFMDTYRVPRELEARRAAVVAASRSAERRIDGDPDAARPIRVERNVWIGFDVCVLPGVTIGQGSVVGAKSVVFDDVPPYSIAVGNPARVVRGLQRSDMEGAQHAHA